MAETPQKRDGWLTVLYVLLLLVGLALLAMGLLEVSHNRGSTLLGLGVLAILIPAATYPIASALFGQHATGEAQRTNELLSAINQRLLLSDSAKRIAYREQDRNALRDAIRHDMSRRDFEAALVLVQAMANEYGYREEAEKFRQEIIAARKADTDAKIEQAITGIDMLIQKRDWPAAAEEAARTMRLYPEELRTGGLDKRVQDAKLRYKNDLEKRFLETAERDDVDGAMELLKELDAYMSGDEAARLREVARTVVGKKRENMGVQFKLAVHDKDWPQAVRIGQQIMHEFPNTRMADEVRVMIDQLKKNASTPTAMTP